jgi:hypothetical protein
MRSYIYRDHSQCTMGQRREIRSAEERDLNPRPEHMFTSVQMPIMPNLRIEDRFDMYSGMMTSEMNMTQMAFETVRFTTAFWMEEHVMGITSCGHYHFFHSYLQVPQGVELPHAELHQDGMMYHDSDTEPYRGLSGEGYYRVRMLELERQVENLQRTRAVLPAEEIRDIGIAIEQGRDKPVPFEHFDENIFKVE